MGRPCAWLYVHDASVAAPVASAKGGFNEASSGAGGSVTVSGLNFGATAASGSVQFADAACSTTAWSSSSSLTCATSQSAVTAGTITISAVVATFPTVSVMSYDAPVASTTQGSTPNLVASGGTSVTVTGLSFGVAYSSPTAKLGGVACRTTSWTTSTTLACQTAWPVAGQKWSMDPWDLTAVMTVNAITGTSVDTMFTFDAPVLSAAMFAYSTTGLRGPSNYIPYRSKMNVPVTGSLYVDLRGSSFGAADATASMAIFGQPCSTSSWMSMTTVLCTTLEAFGSDPTRQANIGQSREAAVVTVGTAAGTSISMFSFDGVWTFFRCSMIVCSRACMLRPHIPFLRLLLAPLPALMSAALQQAATWPC